MKSNLDILNQFEDLQNMEPGAAWHKELLKRIETSNSPSVKHRKLLGISGVIIFLLVINLFSISMQLFKTKKEAAVEKQKNVAREFLIQTSSSKY